MRQIILPTMFLCIITINACSTRQQQEYQPSFESLKKTNPVPEWFRDAKFGIHFHWGGYILSLLLQMNGIPGICIYKELMSISII
jgi:hypothetical protein